MPKYIDAKVSTEHIADKIVQAFREAKERNPNTIIYIEPLPYGEIKYWICERG